MWHFYYFYHINKQIKNKKYQCKCLPSFPFSELLVVGAEKVFPVIQEKLRREI